MTAPTTAAGRALADGLDDCECGHPTGRKRILAIEAEARAAALDEARAAVIMSLDAYPNVNYVRRAILAAIDALREGKR